jgi:hypothetical protein
VDDVSLFRAEVLVLVLVLVLGVSLSVWPDRGMDGWMDGGGSSRVSSRGG